MNEYHVGFLEKNLQSVSK